jgi:hypothetical protein
MFEPWAEISERLRRICSKLQTEALLKFRIKIFGIRGYG